MPKRKHRNKAGQAKYINHSELRIKEEYEMLRQLGNSQRISEAIKGEMCPRTETIIKKLVSERKRHEKERNICRKSRIGKIL